MKGLYTKLLTIAALTAACTMSAAAKDYNPANTFIVSEAGQHTFPTQRISGASIGDVDHVDWIWATKVNGEFEQRLVSDIQYADGTVTFTATGERGNVLLGAFDAQGTCLWTWLLWCTDEPQTVLVETGARFMDRNLGALSANPEDGQATWSALVWQYGRPTPLFGGYEDEGLDENTFMSQAYEWTILNPDQQYEWLIEAETAKSLAEGFANPTTFFWGLDSDEWYGWLHDFALDMTLWDDAAGKSDYDPSPEGYRLPTTEEMRFMALDRFHIGDRITYSNYRRTMTYTWEGNVLNFPCEGSRVATDGGYACLNATCMLWMQPGLYTDYDPYLPDEWWLDETYAAMAHKMSLRFIFQAEAMQMWYRGVGNPAFGHNIRCIAMGETAGVESPTVVAAAEQSIYTLDGRRTSQPAKHGVYVKGGRKYVR